MITIRKLLYILLLSAIVGWLAFAPPLPATEWENPQHVLVLNTGGPSVPWYRALNPIFDKAIADGTQRRLLISKEYLDLFKRNDKTYRKQLIDLLKTKYADTQFDLLVTFGPHALDLVLDHKAALFPDVPLVFGRAQPVMPEKAKPFSEVTGVILQPRKNRIESTLELGLSLHPNTSQVIVVLGTDGWSRKKEAWARERFKTFEGQLEFVWTSEKSMDEILALVESPPKHSLVLYLFLAKDANGNIFVPTEACRKIAASSSAPVYATFDTLIGTGIVGGHMSRAHTHAHAVADLGAKILNGHDPKALPIQSHGFEYVFDWRQIQKWGIKESAIPADSVLHFQTFSVWEKYTVKILIGIFVVVLQFFMIAGLIVNRRKMVRAKRIALESENRYRSMIEASPVSIMAIRDGCFVSVNPSGCRMLGYSGPDEFIGLPALNVVAPESQAMIAERLSRIERGQSNPFAEAILVRKDGTKFTIESTSVSVSIDGKATAMVFAHDISKRKKMEDKLRDSEARLNAFMNHYPANIYIKDQDLKHVYANKSLLDSLGENLQHFVGTTTHDFFPSDVARSIEKYDQAVLVERTMKAQEIKRKAKGGDYRWYNDLKFPIQIDAGKTFIGGISTDITERKRAEKKLEGLRHFEQLLSNISTSFIDVPLENIDQNINYALEQIGRLLGFDRCSLSKMTPDYKEMLVTHAWNQGSISGIQESYALKQHPWFLSPFKTGNALLWNKSKGLIDGSEADIRLLEESGMQSFAGIPVTVAGELKACLGFSSVSELIHWEPELYNRLNHLSRIFGNVLSRKQTDEELQKMQYSVDHSLDRIAWIAPDGNFLYANQAACKEMHYTREQVLAMGVSDVDPDFPQEKWNEHFHRLKEVGSMRLEVQQVDGRGKVHHIDVTSTYNNFGGSEFICSFARDITQLRQAERNLKEQLAFEDLIARLSATFIHIKASEIDRTIEAGLGLVTDFFDIQRSNLFQFSKNMHELQLTHAFVVEGVSSAPETLYKEEHPWFVNRLLSGEPYSFSSPDELPQEAGAERTYLKKAGIKSAAILPLMAAGVSHGGITLSAMDTSRQWSDKLIHQMTILAEVFSSALLRKRAYDIIETRLNIESLLTNLATGFINLDVGETDNYLEVAMGEIAELFNVDRSSILQFDADMSELLRTHIWERDGINPDPHGLPIRVHEQFPKLFVRLKNGETVSVLEAATSPDDEVAAYCQSIGIQSFIMLPLIVGKRNLGYLVVSTIFTKMALTDDQLRHFRLFSTVVANALARQRTALALEESQLQTRMLAGRMLSIQENERKRLARELHDDLSQRLAVLAMSCSRMRTDLAPLSPESTDSINSMHRQLVKISEDVHAISRQLHPSILEDLGLVDAVRNEINAFRQREGLHVDYLPSGIPERLPKGVALCFFRIIQEGLRNIAKHAQAESASIVLTGSAERVALEISDHGRGFDQESNREQLGLGLISIGERVRMINGTIEVTSSPGQGTRIQVSAPIAAEARPKIT